MTRPAGRHDKRRRLASRHGHAPFSHVAEPSQGALVAFGEDGMRLSSTIDRAEILRRGMNFTTPTSASHARKQEPAALQLPAAM
jgi:hypothetical protein